MKIGIFGLGYVGLTSAACLARDGHHVVGVDNNPVKVNALGEGRLPFAEPGLEALIGNALAIRHLTLSHDAAAAVEASDCSIVCVGTPALPDGGLDSQALTTVISEIAALMQTKPARHCLIIRSTILPGTIDELIVPMIEEQTGLVAGRDYGLSHYPEFLREGSAIADHDAPGTLVYSASDETAAQILAELTRSTSAARHRVDARTAEAIKLLNNAWHAAKIGFANEMGLILKSLGVDSHDAFAVLCSDTRLNIAPAYLTPAFAFGGSCLPKDVAALRHAAHGHGLETPHIDGLLAANRNQIREAVRLTRASGKSTVVLIGLSFKPETDDLRNSPYVELAAELLALGHAVRIVDRNIVPARLIGANRDHVASRLPELERLLRTDIDAALDGSGVLIIADRAQAEAHIEAIARHRPAIIDLARSEAIAGLGLHYDGICW